MLKASFFVSPAVVGADTIQSLNPPHKAVTPRTAIKDSFCKVPKTAINKKPKMIKNRFPFL